MFLLGVGHSGDRTQKAEKSEIEPELPQHSESLLDLARMLHITTGEIAGALDLEVRHHEGVEDSGQKVSHIADTAGALDPDVRHHKGVEDRRQKASVADTSGDDIESKHMIFKFEIKQ